MFDVERLIEVWEEAASQFAAELEEFLRSLPAERARFWNIDLWLWLENQRALGFKITSDSYQRLRGMLDRFRDELIAEGVELQQVYTPCAEQKARERAMIRARNELSPVNPLVASAAGITSAGATVAGATIASAAVASASVAPEASGQRGGGPTDDEVRYWVERLRNLIQSIMRNYPAERWVGMVADALQRIGVPQEVASKILAWVRDESDRHLFFKRLVDDALRRSAEGGLSADAQRSPAEELVDLALELAQGLKELSADGKPQRLLKALKELIDRFPEFVPASLRSQDIDALIAAIQQTMQALLEFLESLPPVAYAVIPDLLQGMLDIIGLFPVVGEVADAISGVLSYFRGEMLAVVLSAASLIPLLGFIPGVAKILVRLNKILKAVKRIGKRAAREALEKLLKFLIDELAGAQLSAEWLKKFLDRLRKLLRELLEKLKKGDAPDGPRGGRPPAPDGPNGPPEPRRPPVNIIGRGKWQSVNEAMPPRARAYQTQITGHTGEAYIIDNVKLDGFTDGVLLEAKGPGYAKFVKDGKFTRWFKYKDQIVKQATDQARVARGDPVTWHIADKEAVPAFEALVNRAGAAGKTNVVHTPAVMK